MCSFTGSQQIFVSFLTSLPASLLSIFLSFSSYLFLLLLSLTFLPSLPILPENSSCRPGCLQTCNGSLPQLLVCWNYIGDFFEWYIHRLRWLAIYAVHWISSKAAKNEWDKIRQTSLLLSCVFPWFWWFGSYWEGKFRPDTFNICGHRPCPLALVWFTEWGMVVQWWLTELPRV